MSNATLPDALAYDRALKTCRDWLHSGTNEEIARAAKVLGLEAEWHALHASMLAYHRDPNSEDLNASCTAGKNFSAKVLVLWQSWSRSMAP